MNRLLTDQDYLRVISQKHLDDITLGNNRTMKVAYQIEQTAQQEMSGYLSERYYTENQVFTNTTTFNINNTYYGKSLIVYTEKEYDISTGYNLNERVLYDESIFICSSTASAGVDPSDLSYWSLLCEDKTLFYANTPYPIWDVKKNYTKGTNIWYYNDDTQIGNTYISLQNNKGRLPIQHQTLDELRTLNNNFQEGYSDKALDDGMFFGLSDTNSSWQLTGTYSFTGEYPIGGTSSSTYWTEGDNRNQQLVQYLLDITLYHLYRAVTPRDIPEIRAIAYDGAGVIGSHSAIRWLKDVCEGRVNAQLPEILPIQGSSIMGHSPRPRRNNTF